MVKTFTSGAEVPLAPKAVRVRTPVGAEVGATPTVLQSGDPDVIFSYHACCKDYGVRKYDSLYYSKPLHSILPTACISLLSSTNLLLSG